MAKRTLRMQCRVGNKVAGRGTQENPMHRTKPTDPLKKAMACPFCEGTFLRFKDGAVACDTCQTEGPFVGHGDTLDHKRRAVAEWNRRGAAHG